MDREQKENKCSLELYVSFLSWLWQIMPDLMAWNSRNLFSHGGPAKFWEARTLKLVSLGWSHSVWRAGLPPKASGSCCLLLAFWWLPAFFDEGWKLNSRTLGCQGIFTCSGRILGDHRFFGGKNDRIQYVFHGSLHDLLNKCYHLAGDLGLIPGLGRFPGERNGYPLQCSCLENSMDRGAWWATVHGVAKSQTRLSD